MKSKPTTPSLTKPELRHILDALSRLSFEERYDMATRTVTETTVVLVKIRKLLRGL